MSDMLDYLRNRMRAAQIGDPVVGSVFVWRFMDTNIQRRLKGSGYAFQSPDRDDWWMLTDAGREWLRDASQSTGQGGE